MELLHVATARAIWLFDSGEVNPLGKHTFPKLKAWLQQKYGFVKVPSSANDLDDGKALAFLEGFVSIKGEQFVIGAMRVFSDGVVVDSPASTEVGDTFLADALDGLPSLGLTYKPEMVRRRLYYSEVHVRSAVDLARTSDGAAKFADMLASAFGLPYRPTGLAFSADPDATNQFRIERRIGAPFEEGRYWSQASLPTSSHLRMLNELEQIYA